MTTVLRPMDVEPFPHATTHADIKAYVNQYANDDCIVAYFQLGGGFVEQFIHYKFPDDFKTPVLAVRDSDTVTAHILANRRQYRLPRHLAMLVFFFYGLPHSRIGDPCTRGHWVAAARDQWEPFKVGYMKKEAWMKETGRIND